MECTLMLTNNLSNKSKPYFTQNSFKNFLTSSFMKKTFYIIICIILTLTIKTTVAQENTTQNVIILSNGDTIFSPQIVTNKMLTNQDEITYIDNQNNKQKLDACQVKEYYLRNEFFHSERIKSENICRLVTYEVGGYISFGLSYCSNGDMNFYVKKDNDVTSLEKHRYNLKSFFSNYLEGFDTFYAKYNVKLSYDYKTLAEFISAYNAYKFPDTYVFESVKTKEKGRFGIIASGGFVNTNISGFFEDKLNGGSFSIGIVPVTRYSRSYALYMPITYNAYSAKGSNTSIHWSSINFEPYLALSTIPKGKINFEFGAGIGALYSLNSYIDCSSLPIADQNNVKFNKMNFGTNLSFIANINRRLKAQLMYARYNSKSKSIKVSSPDDTSVSAHANNFRFMISYYF